jgi:hypothetical protein
MKRRFALLFLVAGALVITWPAASSATLRNNSSDTYQLFMDVPNVSQDAAGDTLSLTGQGTWSVHSKFTDVSGAVYVHGGRRDDVRRQLDRERTRDVPVLRLWSRSLAEW